MYGRGYGFYGLVPRGEQWKHGGVAWTIKDGILFDAQALLREVEGYVEQEKARLRGKAVTTSDGAKAPEREPRRLRPAGSLALDLGPGAGEQGRRAGGRLERLVEVDRGAGAAGQARARDGAVEHAAGLQLHILQRRGDRQA